MTERITTLPNGLRVVTAHMDDAYSVTASIVIGVGSRHEQFSINGGVSHFLEHLLFKGSKKRPTTKIISEQIDAVGGYNNAYTSNEITNYYVKVPADQVTLAVDILADMIRNPLFDSAEIDRERGVVLEEMNVYHDDPSSYVHRLAPKLLWPGHPLSQDVIGSAEIIQTISRQSIASYHKAHYVPAAMVVAVAGRVDHNQVVSQIEKLLGDMKGVAADLAAPVAIGASEQLAAVLQKDTAQNHLTINALAYPYLHPDDTTAKVVATILGRGLSSRLFLNVREKQGLAYSVSAGIENFSDTGDFGVYAGVNIDKTPQAIKAIVHELQRMATETVEDDELSKAKSQMGGGLQMSQESNSSVADRMGTQLLLLGDIKSVEDTLAEIAAVTAADVKRVAAEMLAPGRLRMGIISPHPETAVKAFEEAVAGLHKPN